MITRKNVRRHGLRLARKSLLLNDARMDLINLNKSSYIHSKETQLFPLFRSSSLYELSQQTAHILMSSLEPLTPLLRRLPLELQLVLASP